MITSSGTGSSVPSSRTCRPHRTPWCVPSCDVIQVGLVVHSQPSNRAAPPPGNQNKNNTFPGFTRAQGATSAGAQKFARLRSRHLTADALIKQCKYIYGDGTNQPCMNQSQLIRSAPCTRGQRSGARHSCSLRGHSEAADALLYIMYSYIGRVWAMGLRYDYR